jgi:triacylglycerol lipase
LNPDGIQALKLAGGENIMPYPIVLAHGVCPFDTMWNRFIKGDNKKHHRTDRLHYFKGIRAMLEAKGCDVFHSRVSWAAGVDRRAKDLRSNIVDILERTGAEKTNIIAHSMGGLDARHMLFGDRNREKIHERIASLTTISTPHDGTPFADWGIDHLPFVIPIIHRLGLDIHGLQDLRTEACKAFNERSEVKSFEKDCQDSIRFQTYAGMQGMRGMFALFRRSFRVIEKKEGENDGLVSVRSARWREEYFKGILNECDHLNELGWWNPGQLLIGESPRQLLRRIHRFYAGIAEDLP